MSFTHPDEEHRQDLLSEAEFYAALEAESLEPLPIVRVAFSEQGEATGLTVLSEQTYGLNHR
jgi:hypothetical protein